MSCWLQARKPQRSAGPRGVPPTNHPIPHPPPGAAGGSGPDQLWSLFQQHGGWWPAKTTAQTLSATGGGAPTVSAPEYPGDAAQYPYLLQVYESPLLGRGEGANLPWLQGSPDPMTTIAWQSW